MSTHFTFFLYHTLVQCPTFPQPNNPYQIITKNFVSFAKTYIHNLLNPDQPQQQYSTKTIIPSNKLGNYGTGGTSTSTVSSSNDHQTPKRYSNPTIIQTLIQIIIHLMFGLIFGLVIDQEIHHKQFHNNDKRTTSCHFDYQTDFQSLFLIACALTCIFSFMTTYYATTSAKISSATTTSTTPIAKNIQHYHNYHELLSHDNQETTLPFLPLTSLCSIIYHETMQQIQQSSVLFYWIISPLIATLWIYLLNGTNFIMMATIGISNDNQCTGMGLRKKMIVTFMEVYGVTLFMSLYIVVVDVFTRKLLATRGLDVYKLISQSSITLESTAGNKNIDDAFDLSDQISIESVVVSVILAGFGSDTIDDVLCPRMIEQDGKLIRPMMKKRVGGVNPSWVPSSSTHNFSNVDLEGMEMKRNKDMSQKVASAILTGTISGYSTFEEELLKFMVLESLGGRSANDDMKGLSSENLYQGLSIPFRSYKTIMRFLRTMDQGSVQTLSIVRALCAYAGGIGEALTYISHPISRSQGTPTTFVKRTENCTFSFQPSAVLSAMYAIEAASRFILLNLKNRKARFNHLSLFIPVILQTSYTLRCGALDYAKYQYDSSDPIHDFLSNVDTRGETFVNFCTIKHPDLTKLVKTCDDSVIEILKFQGSNISSLELSEIKVDDHVKEWIVSLLYDKK